MVIGVLLVLVLVVFAMKRSIDTYTEVVHESLFELHYLEHPTVTALHVSCGILFVLLVPLQLLKNIRTKTLNLRRRLGRVLVVCVPWCLAPME